MTLKERALHMILFEIFALLIFVSVAVWFTNKAVLNMTGLGITLSLIAMAWNFLYNLGFDKIYGYNRLSRTVKMRFMHGLGFEFGMVVFSFPIIMWVMEFSLIQVLIMDIGAVLFFMLYAIIFNWIYDVLRHKYFSSRLEVHN